MLFRYLRALEAGRSDHSVISLLPIGSVGRSIEALGVTVLAPGTKGLLPFLGFMALLPRTVANLKPETIYCWMYHACIAGLWARLGPGRKTASLIWGIHHSVSALENEKPAMRLIIRGLAKVSQAADVIAFCSTTSRRQHEALGFLPERSITIENGVDVNEFRPDDAARGRICELAGVLPGQVIVGNVARAHPMKDHPSFVRAIAEVARRGRDVHGVIIGEGHSNGPAEKLAQELGISERLSVIELRSDLPALVPGFDVFLLSSKWGEAFGIAVAEAMSAEVPCVVTDVGDSAFLVSDTGRTALPGDVNGMADAVISIIDLPRDERSDLGKKARMRVIDNFSIQKYVERTEDAYELATRRRLTRGKPPK
jgi:glycosyltransferase involved in cell wall biosynthesis